MSGRRAKRERRSKRSESGWPGEIPLPFHGEPDLVRFYIPLPDPLKLADGTQLPVRYVWNPIADDGPCFLLPPEGDIKYAARQIAIFHQDEVSMDVEQFAAAMKIMALALEKLGSSERMVPAQGEPRLPIPHTTVEMVCVLDPSQPDPVDHALEQAIDVIAEFQTYYHLSTKIPTRRLTRKALPRGIPIIFRPFNTPDKWESAILEVNDWSTTVLAAVAPTMSAEQLQGLLEHNQASRAEVFKAFVLMRQEAVLAHTAGSTSAASLFVAIAAETLLTELFLLLSWEEDASLIQTAAVLGERDNISKRLLSELASRLKGDWDRNGSGPLGEWQHQIASLRNEVAHAGTLPSEPEIGAALNALSSLEEHVGNRLAESVKSYPLASNIFLGTDGLERRQKLKQWHRSSAKVRVPRHLTQLFSMWKKEVQRIRSGPHEGKSDQVTSVVVMFGNGAERWYLVDEQSDLSCPIDKPELEPKIRRNLDIIRAERQFDVLSVGVPSCQPPSPVNAQWVPSYLVLPTKAISRWEQCLWAPST